MKRIFKSYITLSFSNPSTELNYIKDKNTRIKKHNILFLVFFMLLSAGNLTMHIVYYELNQTRLESYINFILSIIVTAIYIILIIIAVFVKDIKTHRILNYLNYYLLFFTLSLVRFNILIITDINKVVAWVLYMIEFLIRHIYLSVGLVDFLDSFIIHILTLITTFIYYPSITDFTKIYYYTLAYNCLLLCVSVVSYFYTLERKKYFYYFDTLEKKINWYKNIFENMNSGFITIKDGNVNYINKVMMDKISRHKELINNQDNTDTVINLENKEYIIEYSRKIINALLTGISFDANRWERQSTISCTDISMLGKETSFLESFKSYYIKHTFQNDFILVGNKSIEGEIYQIYGRYYPDDNTMGSNDYEFVFNDITRTRIIEEKNAEFKYKSMFLSKVAHEFKNPLICINELIDQVSEDSKYHKKLNKFPLIKALSNYLLILVKDFDYFSLSQMNRNIILDITEVNLLDVLKFCKDIAKSLMTKNGKNKYINFSITKEESVPSIIKTDEIKLKQILINLLSNSIKFTNKGSIDIELKMIEDKDLQITVSDTGKGISESVKNKLFTPYTKEYSISNNIGTGLGLSIVKELTTKLGTSIEYSSIPGEGSRFWFTIPLLLEGISPTHIPKSNCHSLNMEFKKHSMYKPKNSTKLYNSSKFYKTPESLIQSSDSTVKVDNIDLDPFERIIKFPFSKEIIISENSVYTHEKEQIKFKSNKSSVIEFINKKDKTYQHNIIVVDDEVFTIQSNIRVLKNTAEMYKLNINILQASDGLECLYLVYKYLSKGETISCILSDQTMNYMNGSFTAEILAKIYSIRGLKPIPFYLITAYEDEKSLGLLKDNNVDNVFIKPLSKEKAENLLKKLLIDNS